MSFLGQARLNIRLLLCQIAPAGLWKKSADVTTEAIFSVESAADNKNGKIMGAVTLQSVLLPRRGFYFLIKGFQPPRVVGGIPKPR